MSTPPRLDPRHMFGTRLGHALRLLRRALDERLRPFGLTEATWRPLLHVARGGKPMRQKDLADSLGIEGSTLVRLIDALDDAGLIERQIEDDRRARFLQLTARGRRLVNQVEATAVDVRKQALAGVTDEELTTTMSVIDRISAALERRSAS